MTSNETRPSRWTVFRQSRWQNVGILLTGFVVFCWFSEAHNLFGYALSAACSVGWVFLMDCYREFIFPPALRVLRWPIFFPLAFAFALGSTMALQALARHFDISKTQSSPVVFMFLIAATGALSSMSKALRERKQTA